MKNENVDLDALLALADAASDGPWQWLSNWVWTGNQDPTEDAPVVANSDADAEFIAACREAVPGLVSYCQELETALTWALEWCEQPDTFRNFNAKAKERFEAARVLVGNKETQ